MFSIPSPRINTPMRTKARRITLRWIAPTTTTLLPSQSLLPKSPPIKSNATHPTNSRCGATTCSLHPLVRPLRPPRISHVGEIQIRLPPLLRQIHPIDRICQGHVVVRVNRALHEHMQLWIREPGLAVLEVCRLALQIRGPCGNKAEHQVSEVDALEVRIGVEQRQL
jgi:hypothetical protein